MRGKDVRITPGPKEPLKRKLHSDSRQEKIHQTIGNSSPESANVLSTQNQIPPSLAHAENFTQEELEALHSQWLKQSVAWVVRERDGSVHESDMSEIDEVLKLNDNPSLPYTYKELKSSEDDLEKLLTKKISDLKLGEDTTEPPTTANKFYSTFFFSRVFGRIIVPWKMFTIEPYSSIGALKEFLHRNFHWPTTHLDSCTLYIQKKENGKINGIFH